MQKHTHQYKRVKPERKRSDSATWFKCTAIGCPHRLKKELLEGRISKCPRCGNDFPIMKKHTELAFPHCDACTNSEKQKQLNEINQFLENL